MGDQQVCPDRPKGSNVLASPEERLPFFTLPPSAAAAAIPLESWALAEETTRQVLERIQPTLPSEHKRRDVIHYLQTLFRRSLRCEVFAYGSVPLKTYLPDGDIDLTALSSPNVEDVLICNIFDVLKREELNQDADFQVKDVQLISAEVKLVKCLVQNIIVDISCNQLGGLCTLCFLEQVDHLLNKDHLFKRSIILIKAWCYYESRVLGATHGLISTYALEILVLYIFHMFHSSLNGPLSVLYRFLDYFSRFDWEKYGVSLNGPVCKSSLPDIVAVTPEVAGNNLLLSEQFLRNCMSMFSIPSVGQNKQLRPFPQKFINIIDPLKANNNLGRSVNKGSYFRIRSAFGFGARKLGSILLLPGEGMAEEVKNFFRNTLVRHEGKLMAGRQFPILSYIVGGFVCLFPSPHSSCQSGDAASIQDGSDMSAESMGISNPFMLHGGYRASSHTSSAGGSNATSAGSSSPRCLNSALASTPVLDNNLMPLSDLSGDYDSHIRSLLYGQCCHGCAFSAPMLCNGPALPNLGNKKSWHPFDQSLNFWWNHYYQMNANSFECANPFYPIRGTGTYIPKMNRSSSRKARLSAAKGRDQGLEGRESLLLHRHAHSLGLSMLNLERSSLHKGSNELLDVSEHVESGSLISDQSDLPNQESRSSIIVSAKSKTLEFGSFGHLPYRLSMPEGDSQADTSTLHCEASDSIVEASSNVASSTGLLRNGKESVADQPYPLKEEDFLPLPRGMPTGR